MRHPLSGRLRRRLSIAALLVFSPLPIAGQSAVFTHVVSTANHPFPAVTELDHALLNGNILAQPMVMTRRTSPTGATSDTPHTVLVYYNVISQRWSVSTEDAGALVDGASFEVWVPRPAGLQRDGLSTVHTASAGNTNQNVTYLDDPLLNGFSVLWVFAIHSGGALINHDIGVWYDDAVDKWSVFNQDLAPMAAGTEFHVCSQLCGIGFGGSFATLFTIACPTPAGDACDLGSFHGAGSHLLVSSPWIGVYDDHPLSIGFESGTWKVHNADGAAMPANQTFKVAESGGIYESGFDTGNFLGWITSP